MEWLGLGGKEAPPALDAATVAEISKARDASQWVPLLGVSHSVSNAPLHVFTEGLGYLESLEGPVSIVLFCSCDNSARKSTGLASLVTAAEAKAGLSEHADGSTAWLLKEPLSASPKEGTTLLVECSSLLHTGTRDTTTPRQLLCALLLVSSVVAYEAPPLAAGTHSVERWAALESLMQMVSYSVEDAPANNGSVIEQAEQEGVLLAMPALCWAFESAADTGASPTKELEEGLLKQEGGFSDETGRRNNARLLLSSVFKRREAVGQHERLRKRLVESASPLLALGRVCKGPMLAAMLRHWGQSLKEGTKASIIAASRVAVEDASRRALKAALEQHELALLVISSQEAVSADVLEEQIGEAQKNAENLLNELTAAVAPMPRNAGAPPQPPTLKLRRAVREEAKKMRLRNAAAAAKAGLALAQKLHADLVKAADLAARIKSGPSLKRGEEEDEEDEEDDDGAPTSRRAELWLSTYKGRLGQMLAAFDAQGGENDEARESLGRFWAGRATDVIADRAKISMSVLEGERTVISGRIEATKEKTEVMDGELAVVMTEARGAMQQRHVNLAERMTVSETGKMEKESALATAKMELESALRGFERLEQRLQVKLDGNVSRAVARVADARSNVQRFASAATDASERTAALQRTLGESRLDALRVRCVTLGHEKANLGEHMELLEEHLERLKSDLEGKQAEVAEVEHQWSQTKSRLPSLKSKHRDAEKLRSNLAEIAKKFKSIAFSSKSTLTKGSSLPRALIQQLDPMERQALDDL